MIPLNNVSCNISAPKILNILNCHKIQSLYDSIINSINLKHYSCPSCNRKALVVHGYYFRNVILLDGSFIKLRIQRVLCPHCKDKKIQTKDPSIQVTHALLPSWILAYSPFLIQVVFCISWIQPTALYDACVKRSIDVDTALKYRRRYRDIKAKISSFAIVPIIEYLYSFFDSSSPKYKHFLFHSP